MHPYALICLVFCVYKPLKTRIYACTGLFLLSFTSCPTSLLLLARRATQDSLEAM